MAIELFFYKAYGRTIQADIYLPTLPRRDPTLDPAVIIHSTAYPALDTTRRQKWARSQDRAPSGHPWLTMQRFIDDGGFYCQFGNHIEFAIDGTGKHIWSAALCEDSISTATPYLYGFVFGLAFYLQGATCLHASAVIVEDKAVLFVGDSGYGKSSLAAAFVLQGYPLLTDDLVVLKPRNHSFLIPPAVPAIRLQADTADLMFGSNHTLPQSDVDSDKYQYELDEKSPLFARHATPLAAIYLLSKANLSHKSRAITQLSKRESLLNLSRFGYLPSLMDTKMRRTEFETLASLVRTIPVFQLPAVSDPAQLPDLCHKIIKSMRNVH